MKQGYILAIDQGTTSSRAIIFDASLRPVASSQREFTQHFPESGWVEHEPDDLFNSCVTVCHEALEKAGIDAKAIIAIGISNQRETAVVWDRQSGKAIYRAIVWQDRRTAAYCESLREQGHESELTHKTGLRLDPYFSATKVNWILENVEGARAMAEAGALAFGTVDSYLIWRLSGGTRHVTDATNASRTALYNIREAQWDESLLRIFDIPANMLPTVLDCAADFAHTSAEIFGVALPITAVAGDQHAATIGQACFEPGMLKSTYGTGCFALLNTGGKCVTSNNRLLSTIAYQLDGKPTYAIEGSIFIAGAAVQWLRDGLQIIDNAAQSEQLAIDAQADSGVYFVPAFTGLGAPYWDSQCRGAILGLSRDSDRYDIARAALRSVAYQTRDLHQAMLDDWQRSGQHQVGAAVLRVDGGMAANNWMMQSLADILQAQVDRPEIIETTALGVAWLAGMEVDFYPNQTEFSALWSLEQRFSPKLPKAQAEALYSGWKACVQRVLS